MKVFQLSAEPRTNLGKKATKALRSEKKIPVVLNGGEVIELPYSGTLKAGEKLVEIGNGKGLITTDLVVSSLSNLTSTEKSAWQCSRISSSTP